jgi:hypothetical protein
MYRKAANATGIGIAAVLFTWYLGYLLGFWE